MAILEHGGDSRLFVRESTGEIRLLMEKLELPNGVVLSPDESYILVAETGAYRITRIWLTGSKTGEVESLLENLPGFPGDLSIAPDGTYWTTLFSPRKKLLDLLAPWPSIRKILLRLPPAWLPKATPYPYLIRFNNKGEVIETLQASKNTKGIPSFSSAVQTDNEMLLGTPGGVGEID
ncbi:SMP-30/gluconolactonase/LRE family protein [Pseudomonas aeruginosa]|uniref:SMP-30/gluconolactonase/LRE family protein n=1 Tax=Pseudomonas aeruginosa TaxID=287 RepID=UPI003B6388C4